MRYSLLDLVQRILESVEADEVSTVGETPDSLAVANIVKECYFDIVGQHSMAEQEGLYKLDSAADDTKPALMLVPSAVSSIKWVKYTSENENTQPLRNMTNEEFIYIQSGLELTDPNVGEMTVTINSKPFKFRYRKDNDPLYYSVFDDRFVIFDSFKSTNEVSLSETNSLIWATLVPTFEMNDSWVPDLDPRQFQLLLSEAKALAFVEIKQAPNPKAEQKARKNHILTQMNKRDNQPGWGNQEHASFGRRGANGYPRNQMQRDMRNGN